MQEVAWSHLRQKKAFLACDTFASREVFIQFIHPLTSALDNYASSKNTSGFCSAILNKASAGPLGLRRPCSQS